MSIGVFRGPRSARPINAAVVSRDASMGSPIGAIVVTVMPRLSASDKTYLRDYESDFRARSVIVRDAYANP